MSFMTSMTRRLGATLIAAGLVFPGASAPAPTNPPPRVGLGMALSGGLAGLGKSALLAMQIWAADVNAKGGLLNREVKLVYYDDQSVPATVPGIYSKLMDIDKVDLVVSGYASSQIAAAMPTVIQRKRLFMALFGLATNDRFNYDRYFQMQPNGPDARIEFSKAFLDVAMRMNPKPQTLAILGADAEFPHIALDGARENAKRLGLKIVYDRFYPPNAVEFGSMIRAVKATNPDLVFVASYPPDSAGLIRAVNEVGLNVRMFGGGMIGLQSAAVKTALGPLLNGVVSYDLYVPEPTMKFQGTEDFLTRYRQEAQKSGVDPLGFYMAPFAYAEMQILEQAIKAVGSLDEGKLAEYIHANAFHTVAGEIRFEKRGEWAEPRILLVQYQGISGNAVEQFMQAGKQVIVYPPKFKSGEFKYPFRAAPN